MTFREDIIDSEVVALYHKGHTYREIAHRFNTDSKIIVTRLEKNGIIVERLPNKIRVDLDDDKIVSLYSSGCSAPKLAKLFNTSDVTICNRLKSAGCIPRHFKRDDIPLEEIIKKYTLDKKSTIEIAKDYDTSHELIKRRLKSAGIPRRDKKQALEKYARINECVICGIKFRPKKHCTDTNSLLRKTCGEACHSVLMSEIQSENPANWKGGLSQSHYQTVARKIKKMMCEVCEKSVGERLDTHHADGDHANNEPDNTHIWCVICHAKYHYITENRGLRGWNPNTPKLKEFRNRLDALGIEYTIPI